MQMVWSPAQRPSVASIVKLVGRTAPAIATTMVIAACSPTADDSTERSSAELASRPPDPTGRGPHQTTSAEYRLPARVDEDILSDRATEIWARLYRPLAIADKRPLLVFLHGNHGTCGHGENPRIDDNTQYTRLGTCPPDYVVAPSHLGYGYLAERLASWGYIVVSINANRGITAGMGLPTDPGLNLARGRLILKHLQILSEWNAASGTTPGDLGVDLAGALDLENVGLMGHSRGGEGARAAYNLYHDADSPWPQRITGRLAIKSVVEIGPVDGQTNRRLDAPGTAWIAILPMCDGDVSSLDGMRPFDRMLSAMSETRATSKSLFAVWGANHNFYNTEWQQSESRGCLGAAHTPIFEQTQIGSEKQQTSGLYGVMGSFRAHVGRDADPALRDLYDPLYSVPEALEALTRVQRAHADAAHPAHAIVLEDFSQADGTSLSGEPMRSNGVELAHKRVSGHDPALRAAALKWTTASADAFLEVPFAPAGRGVDASRMRTLDLRASRQLTMRGMGRIDFSIQLVNSDETYSRPMKLSDYVELPTSGGHVILETARLPLADFEGARLDGIRGVRLVFDQTDAGAIHIAMIRFSQAAPLRATTPPRFDVRGAPGIAPETTRIAKGNRRPILRAAGLDVVEVELESESPFPVMNELARLRIGAREALVSRYPDDGDTHRIIFEMPRSELERMPDGVPVTVRYGSERATHEWDFGPLDKASLRR